MDIIDKIYYKNYIIAAVAVQGSGFTIDLVAYKNNSKKYIKPFCYVRNADFECTYSYSESEEIFQIENEVRKIKKKIDETLDETFKDLSKIDKKFVELLHKYLKIEIDPIVNCKFLLKWENPFFADEFNFNFKKFSKKGKLVKENNNNNIISFACNAHGSSSRVASVEYNLYNNTGSIVVFGVNKDKFGYERDEVRMILNDHTFFNNFYQIRADFYNKVESLGLEWAEKEFGYPFIMDFA